MAKSLSGVEIERNFLNLIKDIYGKLIADVICNGEKLHAFP